VKITVDPSTPVVQLVQGLARCGLTLKADGKGGLVICQANEYLQDGKMEGGFVPSFLRFDPKPEEYCADF
jgi:hypothetical protein